MNANMFRPDSTYWNNKLANYLHDPPDKALHIPGHEERSRILLDILTVSSPNKVLYQKADQIASGMDRAQFPGYSYDIHKSGAIDFVKLPVLTHPTGEMSHLTLKIDDHLKTAEVFDQVKRIIAEDIMEEKHPDVFVNRFKGDEAGFSSARFHYIHHVLRERLAAENIGGIGGAWHRIPADTRIPDHSVWQHCGMVSALSSCFELSGQKKASLMVFSITPVQDFISRARKLRDFWTGSLILSWLAFEGIRYVIYHLGSDHIIYPSLIGQPMVNRLLEKECGLTWFENSKSVSGIATFPNKFVCLAPAGQEKDIADAVETSITDAWMNLGNETLRLIEKIIGKPDAYLTEQFKRQMAGYWNFHWSACPFTDETTESLVKELLHKDIWEKPFEFIKDSKTLPYPTKGEGSCYSVTHAISQGVLAAGKTFKTDIRKDEPGIKCAIHGDFEILHFDYQPGDDKNPRPKADPFWETFKGRWKIKTDFKPSERLSSIALVKRIIHEVIRELPDHPLYSYFNDAEKFPSTTEMAISDWLDRFKERGFHKEIGDNWRKKISEYVHQTEKDDSENAWNENYELKQEEKRFYQNIINKMENDPLSDEDKYYAILLMDGDRMGKLVNGETLSSTWESILHPELVKRFKDNRFDKPFYDFWKTKLKEKRLISPAVHAAISEALADFSLHSVPEIIKKYHGRLIYAGGDDVCAIMRVSEVLQAACEISEAYTQQFIQNDRRLAVHLGKGDKISISAGILIAHHKKPLSAAMRRAHELLEKAKNDGGRNAFALELDKRSGGGRIFISKWDETPPNTLALNITQNLLQCFIDLGRDINQPGKKSLSSSLVYRMSEFKDGMEAILTKAPQELKRFIARQVHQSGKKGQASEDIIAQKMTALIARKGQKENEYRIDTNSLIIAGFIGSAIMKKKASNVKEAKYEQY